MRKINNNDLDLEGKNGELITVTVNSTGAAPLINWTLIGATFSAGPTPTGGAFTLATNPGHLATLTVLFTFPGPTSDTYHVIISGSLGGPPASISVTRETAPSRAIVFAFDIIP